MPGTPRNASCAIDAAALPDDAAVAADEEVAWRWERRREEAAWLELCEEEDEEEAICTNQHRQREGMGAGSRALVGDAQFGVRRSEAEQTNERRASQGVRACVGRRRASPRTRAAHFLGVGGEEGVGEGRRRK